LWLRCILLPLENNGRPLEDTHSKDWCEL